MSTELTNLQEDLKTVSQKVDSLYEKISQYLSYSESSPTSGLFMAGVKSSLEQMSRFTHKTHDEMERFVAIINEMKAVVDEIHVSTRLVRNRIYCLAGEKAQLHAAEELGKVTKGLQDKNNAPGKDVVP